MREAGIISAEVVVAEPVALAEALAARLAREARAALAARGAFSIALPGGSVAATFFPRLARAGLDRAHTHFFWCDERGVPPGDPDSNYGLARSLWLEPAAVPDSCVHRMRGEAADLEQAAWDYQGELRRALGDPPRLDVALLGVGPDGHVASLFPGHPLLDETDRWVAAVEDAPKPPPRRLTLTQPALAAARLVVVAAFGAGKAEVIHAALDEPQSILPVARVARRAAAALFLLDPEAAALRR
jgi:6-phosphogluconolactonase